MNHKLYYIVEHGEILINQLTWDEAIEFIDNIEDIENSYAIITEHETI